MWRDGKARDCRIDDKTMDVTQKNPNNGPNGRKTMPNVNGTEDNPNKAHAGSESTMQNGNGRIDPFASDNDSNRYWKTGEKILGRYQVVELLGQGGMGVVYRCKDLVGNVDVAVKALPPQVSHNPAEMEDVRDNYTLVTKLAHPNIANYKTLEKDDATGDCYLVMDYVEGESLRLWMRKKRREGTLSLEAALPILHQVAEALDAAHRQGVIHRDVKPDNVKIAADGTVKVLDFGLAAQIRSSMARLSNETVARAGTNLYKSPEQWLASTSQGEAADQYSLAVTAYELLSGHVPFESDDMTVLMKAVLERAPEPIESLPSYANIALMAGLAKKAEDRYASCVDFVHALGGEKVRPRGGGKHEKEGNRWIWLGVAAIALIAFVGIVYALKSKEGEELSVTKHKSSVVIDDEYYHLKGSLKEFYENIYNKHKDEWDRGQTFEEHMTDFENNFQSGMGAIGSDDQKAYGFFKKAEQERKWLVASISKRESALEARRNAESAYRAAVTAEAGQYAYNDLQKTKKILETAIKKYEEGKFDDAQKDFIQTEEMFKVAERNAKDAHIRQLVNQISDYIGFNHEDDAQAAINKLKELDQEKAAEQQIKLNAALQAREEKLREERLKQLESTLVSAIKKDDLEKVKELMDEIKKVLKDTMNIDEWLNQSAMHWDAEAQYCFGVCYEKGKVVEKDMSKALEWYRKSVEKGFASAQNNLGMCYLEGNGVERNVSKAVELFRKSADKGVAAAQNNLGYCYLNDEGVERNVSKAVELFRKSAEQDNATAQFNLGHCYYYGEGVEKDVTKAVELFRKSAEKGEASAQNYLGLCYESGKGVEKDVSKAVEWYRKSAEQEWPAALYNLGVCYHDGRGVERNISKAVELYRKSAEKGFADAQNSLGLCYESGKGVEKDVTKAMEWYRKSAEQGNVAAQFNLGVCYYYGKGVEKDVIKAVELFRKSAEKGVAGAQNYLGLCYENGEGVEKDLSKAVEWYRKSAEQGWPVAQYNLGVCYHDGRGVERNVSKAVELYRKSAEQDCAVAQYFLGMCYAEGSGVEKDMSMAVEWYRKSVEKGFASAQNNLGMCYLEGNGVERNVSKAVELFRKSAEQDCAAAQFNLGWCYEEGSGVEKDISKAVEWYRKAAAQGDKYAEERLKKISK